VKIAVRACGICGTDLHEYTAGPIFIPSDEPHPTTGATAPVIVGHELAGEIVDIGDGVEGFEIGDPVAVEPVIRCGNCPACARGAYNLCVNIGFHGISGGGGGLSEYTVVPAYMAHRLPDEVGYDQGAIVEPMAVSFHGVRVSGFRPGDIALVLGAGPIGATTVACLRAAGAQMVIVSEVSDARKKTAERLGADLVLDPSETDVAARVAELTAGRGVDVSFDAAGVEATWSAALAATRPEGTVVSLAIWEEPIRMDLNTVVLTEQNIKGSICYVDQDYPTTIAMIADGRLPSRELITKRIALADVVEEGFEELVRNRAGHVKIIVEP
jgi:(R,R)-butanediol dehydrogenase / meso-butanediol dehydrogenase / diacetyl reductase